MTAVLERVAAAPISWGVCEVPGWVYQLDPDRVLREMTELGFRATEFGPVGILPGRNEETGRLDGGKVPVDLAANAESLGVVVLRTRTAEELGSALAKAKEHQGGLVLVHVETDPIAPTPASDSWLDVPVSEVSGLEPTRDARQAYEARKPAQRPYL